MGLARDTETMRDNMTGDVQGAFWETVKDGVKVMRNSLRKGDVKHQIHLCSDLYFLTTSWWVNNKLVVTKCLLVLKFSKRR